LQIGVPFISVIVGEGGSGGALALATANRVLMLEHAIYSVASPEACASILWRSRDKAQEAAAAMKLTAQHLKKLGVIDRILEEPIGGAHREPKQMIEQVGVAVAEELTALEGLDRNILRDNRREKFLAIGRKEIA